MLEYKLQFNKENKILSVFAFILFFIATHGIYAQKAKGNFGPITIVIHGGAGTIEKENMSLELEKSYTVKLQEALTKGYEILDLGGSSIEAVVSAVSILEDSPLFNAGKGAVFTHEGKNELDASIMDGNTLNAGAVAGVSTVKNPIKLAETVMTHSAHVMLTGSGAERFAEKMGIEIVDPEYFYTERRYKNLQKLLEEDDGDSSIKNELGILKYGTVGVLALDRYGNLAAGTSTGGMTNKKYGRIGDTPLIGAGTYAENESCAVSSTGHGEYFIRKVVAYDIAAKIKYGGMTVQEAAEKVVYEELPALGGNGGVICLDRMGNFSMEFNTKGMYRGFKQEGKGSAVLIYK